MTTLITILVFALVPAAVILGVFLYIKYKITRFGQDLLGTPGASLSEMKKVLDDAYEDGCNTPKSVSAMTTVYLPMIARDFPEFNFNEMKGRAERFLTAHLMAINNRNMDSITEGSEEYRNILLAKIQQLRDADTHEHYEMIRIHQTEISGYTKAMGKCIVTFQSAVECMHYVEKFGNLMSGDKTHKFQTRFEVEVIYIQDREKLENDSDKALGFNCPNCGAPIKDLGHKSCPYCGTAVEEYNIKVWTFSNVRQR